MWTRAFALLACPLAACLAVSPAAVAPGSALAQDTETFRGWRTDCTVESVCVLSTRSGDDGADVSLALRRLPGAGEPWQLVVTPENPTASLADTLAFSVEGKAKLTFNPTYDYLAYAGPAHLFLTNGGLATRLLGEMVGGLALGVFYEPDGGGSARARFDLPGLVSGMEWIDSRQDRTDRDRSVAAPLDLLPDPAMADVRAPVDGGTGERGLPRRLVEHHYLATGCERLDGALLSGVEVVSGRLTDSALLFALPCVATGETVSYRLYVVETGEIGGIEPLSFAAFSPNHGWIGTETLTDVTFDPTERRLTSLRPGRDEDGCGRFGVWRWDGWRFAMLEYRFRTDCDRAAPQSWPVVFRLGN